MQQRKLMHILNEKEKSGELAITIIDTSTSQREMGSYRGQAWKQTETLWIFLVTYQGRPRQFEYTRSGDTLVGPTIHELITHVLGADSVYGYGDRWGQWAQDMDLGHNKEKKVDFEQVQDQWVAQKEYDHALQVLFGDDFEVIYNADRNWDPNYDDLDEEEVIEQETPQTIAKGIVGDLQKAIEQFRPLTGKEGEN